MIEFLHNESFLHFVLGMPILVVFAALFAPLALKDWNFRDVVDSWKELLDIFRRKSYGNWGRVVIVTILLTYCVLGYFECENHAGSDLRWVPLLLAMGLTGSAYLGYLSVLFVSFFKRIFEKKLLSKRDSEERRAPER